MVIEKSMYKGVLFKYVLFFMNIKKSLFTVVLNQNNNLILFQLEI